jgi:hypothetical protein
MIKLNDQIEEKEIKLLAQETSLISKKRLLEIEQAKELFVLEKIYSETKDKTLSTIIKRQIEVNKKQNIKDLIDKISTLELEIKLDKIELRFIERLFRIKLNEKEDK